MLSHQHVTFSHQHVTFIKVGQLLCCFCGLLLVDIPFSGAGCSKGVRELWAYSKPSSVPFEDSFTEYITSGRGSKCVWLITASEKDETVKLTFKDVQLTRTEGGKLGDCVHVYDGVDETGPGLKTSCAWLETSFQSTGRNMLVVYRRGTVEGGRSFVMEISAHSGQDVSKVTIIRIAGIVGGVLAALGVTYIVMRATKCCNCLWKRGNNPGNGVENDRLTTAASLGPEETPQRTSSPASGGSANDTAGRNGSEVATTTTTAAAAGHTNGDHDPHEGGGSDSDDSLHTMNEPPPSYESLYLNEEGITPPKYEPPEHHGRHPPRRVNTFN